MKGINFNALYMRRERMDNLRLGRCPYNKGRHPDPLKIYMVFNRGGSPRFSELPRPRHLVARGPQTSGTGRTCHAGPGCQSHRTEVYIMSWSINSYGISSIHCFADAERAWNQAKPWKNEDASWRPLDNPRKKHMRLIKLNDDRGYECVLYNTPVVAYFADGSVALRCHDTTSTNAFAWCVRPTGCKPTSAQGRMYWEVQTPDGSHFYREGKEPLVLQPESAAWRLTSSPDISSEWAYDPKQGAAVRKQLKPYKTWYATVARLGALPRRVGYHTPYGVSRLLNAADDHSSYPAFAATLGDPKTFLPVAYEVTGARYKTTVPHDRLPRSFA